MTSRSVYEAFDRVWVKMEGYDWWPARIVSDEELDASAQTRPDGCDITVLFYEGTATPASLEHFDSATANITFFETSSEKAVTADADRLAAIRRAETDETANPLKYNFSTSERAGMTSAETGTAAALGGSTSTRRSAGGSTQKQMQRPVSKRSREVDLEDKHTGVPSLQLLPDEKLIDIAEHIQSAVEANDLPSLRIELCDLDNVSVTVRQLESTKIGVAVGSILGRRELEKMWPLARAIISSWARALPVETIEAIKRHQQYRLGRRQDAANNAATMEEDIGSPVQAGAPSFVNYSTTTTATTTTATTNTTTTTAQTNEEPVRGRFVHRIRKLLDNPTDPSIPNVTSADLDAVAEELCRDVVEPEDRKHLQMQLEKPGMVQLRRDLATRTLTGKEFLKLPRSALMTEEEKRKEEARITKMIEDQEKVKLANVAITSLFKCPNCGNNRCSFFEQQIRSADEPTTKFVTCLECKNAWTTE
ncbi:putative transcription elongation factor-like protein [Trypanosoma theileri]|uniref:Putative transcription elongation factor-like protein n=1 Tax=Trypanosoma theileri TaxID=67003 RepID=A0A1X0NRX7_9TRYP|nr:putative transcription elongation factor-like protein [Trypanosoma theileri]ORC87233.1 putative transcription elongation factor-like protein [Trypanosoma theileri]